MNNWYVYRHIRLDKNEPFYIGIGCKRNYGRAYETCSTKRSTFWINVYNKTSIDVEILMDNLSKTEASLKEQEFIKLYGRIDNGTGSLCNLTDGGDGIWNCIRSKETKQKLRDQKLGEKNHQYGKVQSYSTRQKRSLSMVGQTRSNETKVKQSLSSVKSGQAIKTEVFNFKTGNTVGIYHSMSEACRAVGLNPTIYSGKASIVARGIRNHVKGFSFKYI